MRSVIVLSCCALVLSACAGMRQTRESPVASVQTAAEVGKLPTGLVVAVERRHYLEDNNNPLLGILPIMAISTNWYYHHTIKLVSGDVLERDEFMEYKVGDCVAIRSALVVPAFDGECK